MKNAKAVFSHYICIYRVTIVIGVQLWPFSSAREIHIIYESAYENQFMWFLSGFFDDEYANWT